jgi:hypothetical protein
MGDTIQWRELGDVRKHTRKDMRPARIQQYGLVPAFDHVLIRLDHAFFFLFLPAQQEKPTAFILVKGQTSCFRHGYLPPRSNPYFETSIREPFSGNETVEADGIALDRGKIESYIVARSFRGLRMPKDD